MHAKPPEVVLQEWEGNVIDIAKDEFIASLIDITAGESHESLEATIPITAIAEDDASEMIVGSIFRWEVGERRNPDGPDEQFSRFTFLELGETTEEDIEEGKAWARRIALAFTSGVN